MKKLFGQGGVINIGVPIFADSIRAAGASVVNADWQPPANGDVAIGRKLANLIGQPQLEAANRVALEAFLRAEPVIKDVRPARELIPALDDRLILHAGPPICWEQMCGPMQGAVIGAIMYEGWAKDPAQAAAFAASGRLTFAPCHHFKAVGPMAGVISPSMPVWVVTNVAGANSAFSSLNEGLGKVLRFGANSPEVIERLKWMETMLAPILAASLQKSGGIELKPLMAQALQMGDEVHNRNVAASSLLLKRLLPGLLESGRPSSEISKVAKFIADNDHFFLNVSMAACKTMLDAAHGIPHSSVVTTMARNGVEFGIRVSGTGNSWFTAPAPQVTGLYFPNYGAVDVALDLGDSAITETAGFGGFAMAAAPAIVKFVGGSAEEAQHKTRRMRRITIGENTQFAIPSMNFAGLPALIDVRKVVDRGIVPIMNTGIAHRSAGIGQIGAGISEAPLACFSSALAALHVQMA